MSSLRKPHIYTGPDPGTLRCDWCCQFRTGTQMMIAGAWICNVCQKLEEIREFAIQHNEGWKLDPARQNCLHVDSHADSKFQFSPLKYRRTEYWTIKPVVSPSRQISYVFWMQNS